MDILDNNKYFVDQRQVNRDQYLTAERGAGFHPKTGNGIATASFSTDTVSGRVEYGANVVTEGTCGLCGKLRGEHHAVFACNWNPLP